MELVVVVVRLREPERPRKFGAVLAGAGVVQSRAVVSAGVLEHGLVLRSLLAVGGGGDEIAAARGQGVVARVEQRAVSRGEGAGHEIALRDRGELHAAQPDRSAGIVVADLVDIGAGSVRAVVRLVGDGVGVALIGLPDILQLPLSGGVAARDQHARCRADDGDEQNGDNDLFHSAPIIT